jgi:RND family efflux transporter MFP subunit
VKAKGLLQALFVKGLPIVGGLVLLVVVMIWAAGGFRTHVIPPGDSRSDAAGHASATAAGAELQTVPVEEVFKKYIDEAIGKLQAKTRADVSAQVMAQIIDIKVQAGSTVNQGDVLVELDRSAFETQLARAKAALTAADAEVSRTQKNSDRAAAVRKANPQAISQQELDDASAGLAVAKANQEVARKVVAEADVNLAYTTIRAPISGVVVEKTAQKGERAQPGRPLLSLSDPSSLRLEVPVPEELAGLIRRGDELSVRIDAIGKSFPATVDEIVPQADPGSHSFIVKLVIPASQGGQRLVEGMFGRLETLPGERAHLCLPIAAIRRIGQLDYVEVKNPDGTLERRLIQTGRVGRPGHVEVLSGLNAGDEVVISAGLAAAKT